MHRIEGDIIFWKHRGKVTVADMVPVLDDMLRLSQHYPYQFLVIDASEVSSYGADARSYNAAWLRAHRDVMFLVIIHGASTTVRLLVSLVDRALHFINGHPPSLFVSDEAATYPAAEALRQKLNAKLAGRQPLP